MQINTVFDTGATRNTVGLNFLHRILDHPDIETIMMDWWDIEPVPSFGVEDGRSVELANAVTLRLTFFRRMAGVDR